MAGKKMPPGSDQTGFGLEAFVVNGHAHTYFGPLPSFLRMPILLVTSRFDGRLTQVSMLLAFVLLLWADGQAACAALGFGTLDPTLAPAAVFRIERNPDASVALRIAAFCPLASKDTLPCGQRACCASQSSAKCATAKP